MKNLKVDIEAFETVDGGMTVSVSPAVSRRQKAMWYIWIKPDGSALLAIDESIPGFIKGTRIHLPANSPRHGEK